MDSQIALLTRINADSNTHHQYLFSKNRKNTFMRCPNLSELPPPPPGKTGWPWTEESSQLPEKMPNGSEWPRISIVTPSYNYGRFIEETIRSVLLQGYPNLEYIIIDGASTDNTVEIIRKYEQYLTYWISKTDAGQTDALNKGYQYCTGEIFAWLNADDAYANSNCLKNVSAIYQQGYELIIGRCLNVDSLGKEINILEKYNGYSVAQTFDDYIKFWSFIPFPQPGVFISTTLANQCFDLDNTLYYAMDYQLFLRVLRLKPKVMFFEENWVKFRYHGDNKTLNPHSGLSELSQVALSESKKTYGLVKYFIFKISVNDFMTISSMIADKTSITRRQILINLASRPTLIRWPLFWKILIKTCLPPFYYDHVKKIVMKA